MEFGILERCECKCKSCWKVIGVYLGLVGVLVVSGVVAVVSNMNFIHFIHSLFSFTLFHSFPIVLYLLCGNGHLHVFYVSSHGTLRWA